MIHQSLKLILGCIALSWNATKVRLYPYFKQVPKDKKIVVSVGAMAKGADTFADAYVEEKIGKWDRFTRLGISR